MITKQVLAMLAAGGELTAHRTFPAPYHYSVEGPAADSVELTIDDVAELVKDKRVLAPHVTMMTDRFTYRVLDLVWVRDAALKPYTHGYGECVGCNLLPVTADAKGCAVKHGHTKENPTPCDGSGKPLRHLVRREQTPLVPAVAA